MIVVSMECYEGDGYDRKTHEQRGGRTDREIARQTDRQTDKREGCHLLPSSSLLSNFFFLSFSATEIFFGYNSAKSKIATSVIASYPVNTNEYARPCIYVRTYVCRLSPRLRMYICTYVCSSASATRMRVMGLLVLGRLSRSLIKGGSRHR